MPKLLVEFLQEQQEPFALDVYLLERGYSRGKTSSSIRHSAGCCSRKRRYATPNCSEFVKAVFSRLLLHSDQKIKNPGNGCRRNSSREEHADEDKFSSASSTTLYHSCSESDTEDAQFMQSGITSQSSENGSSSLEDDADGRLKWREDCDKQLSPVSVLEETESDEGTPVHEKQYNFKTTKGECSTSMSRFKQKQATHNSVQELQEHIGSTSDAQYIINRRALQQTKRLLIDCVREVIENHRKRDDERGQELKKILGAEELWKLVCENVWLWSQDSIDETNTVRLLHYDFMASAEEWNSASEKQKEEISMEIGDAILDGIINEIVTS